MPPSSDERVGRLPLATGLALFAPLALVGNFAGALLRYPEIGAALLFAPYAALTAALVLSRRRVWIWYIVTGSVAHFIAHWPAFSLSWVAFSEGANISRALVAALLLRRLFDGIPRLDSLPALLRFAITVGAVAPAVGATLGAAVVVGHGASSSYWHPWIAWLMSNALTGLTMLPAFLALFEFAITWRTRHVPRERLYESWLLVAALFGTCAIAFNGDADQQYLALPLYAPMPVLIWAALRFGPGGASLALTFVVSAAVWAVDRGEGPFIGVPQDKSILALQLFVLLTAVSVLCLAAVASGRHRALRLHRALLASLQDQVAILDADGIVLELNESWRRFSLKPGARPFHQAEVGDSYLDACRAAERHGNMSASTFVAGVIEVLNRQRSRFEVEYDHEHHGQRKSFVVTIEALERPEGGAVVVRADVTARRQAQMEVEEQRRQISHLARVAMLGQLSGAFAHELNQPLAAILSNAEAGRRLLRQRPFNLEDIDLILRDIASDDLRAASVIRRLRALFMPGDRPSQAIDARELVYDVVRLAQHELVARHVTASVQIETDLPRFHGDKVQIQQVVLNLLLNGCEAMSATPPPDRQLVLRADCQTPGHIHVTVRDAGSGIPPALADRLFEPFVTTRPNGLGLGLSISQAIVVAHGGQLWAENNPDRGTTMHCLFPVGEPAVAGVAGSDRGQTTAKFSSVV